VQHQVIGDRVEHVGEATILRGQRRFGDRGEPVADDTQVARRYGHLALIDQRVDRPLEQAKRPHQRRGVELSRQV